LKVAAAGRKAPFYDWLRKQDRDNVIGDQLDWADGPLEMRYESMASGYHPAAGDSVGTAEEDRI
jgi:hypothetical protein